MSKTPSDAEIEKLAAEHLKAFAQFSGAGDVWVEGEVAFARAVLAKWGTPTPVGMELAAFLVCTEEGDPDMVFLDRHEAQQNLEDDEQPIPLCRPLQLTQPKE